jgi:DNA-binding transcriptional ArsR family regulator
MFRTAALAETAALVGDPARAAMLMTLMDGRALTAGELARAAGITPQTVSGHLARLCAAPAGGHQTVIVVPALAHMLETIMEVAQDNGPAPRRPVVTGPRDRAMRAARTCYDHLAGQLGVRLADGLSALGHVELSPEGGAVTPAGLAFFREFGVDLRAYGAPGTRVFCRPCLDWSERRLHIGGTLGAALAARCFALNWIRRYEDSRAVAVTPAGRQGFAERFGLSL